MTADGGALQSFLATASSGEVLLQLGVIAVSGLAGLGAAGIARRWRARHLAELNLRGARARLIEIALIEAPVVVLLLAMLVARTVIAAAGVPATLLDIAMQLATALILVRLSIYLLRLALGPRSWLRTWETRLTLLVWLAISFQLVGWFDAIQSTLDAINLLPGKGRFTLWALLKGLVIITVFVLVTSVVARGRAAHHAHRVDRAVDAHRHHQVHLFLSGRPGRAARRQRGRRRSDRADGAHRGGGTGTWFRPAVDRQQFRQRLRAADGQVDQTRRCHQFHRHARHQHRELRLGAGAARPLRRGARPRWRRDAGAEPASHHQPGDQLELFGPQGAPEAAGARQLPRRSGTGAGGADARRRGPSRASCAIRRRYRG